MKSVIKCRVKLIFYKFIETKKLSFAQYLALIRAESHAFFAWIQRIAGHERSELTK